MEIYDPYQDRLCRRCRRNIQIQWTKGRWTIEGYTSLPCKGSHPQVCCNICHITIDRRQVLKHNRIGCTPQTK